MGKSSLASCRKIHIIFNFLLKGIIGALILLLARNLLKGDFFAFGQWWITLLLLGIIFLPLTHIFFSGFHDNGYLFSKTIGLAITGYFCWLLSSLKVLKFTSLSCYILVCIFAVINIILFISLKPSKKKEMLSIGRLKTILSEELLFLIFFLIWTYIRGFKPEAYGTEKFMDYGFMAAMLRAEYMPPKDMWFAGGIINYYYVGQFMASFMTHLSNVSVNVGYNLMLMTLAAFGFVLPYSLVYNVTKNFLESNKIKHKISPVIAGILSGSWVSFAGNMHFTLFYWIVPILRNILGITDEISDYWFPSSTRYIGYNPQTNDKTIHEFPSYSYILGDLHAHVLNTIFVLTLLGILYGWLLSRKNMKKSVWEKFNILEETLVEITNPFILMIGFLIGLFKTTNFWDFPIYYVVSGAVILFSNMAVYRDDKDRSIKAIYKPYLITAMEGIMVIAIAWLTSLIFTLNFDTIASNIRLAQNHTPLYQLIILWGLPIALVLGLLVELIGKYFRNTSESTIVENRSGDESTSVENLYGDNELMLKVVEHKEDILYKENNFYKGNNLYKESAENILYSGNNASIENNTENIIKSYPKKENKPESTGERRNPLIQFLSSLNISEMFILTLGLCAMGLILMPELIYVEDIYSGDYKRANTMFKLTYQAFILFGVSSGFIFMKFIKDFRYKWQIKFTIITFVLFLSTVWYSKVSVKAWYGNIFEIKDYKGLDAQAFLKEDMPDDYGAIKWLNENVKGTPVLLEANGDSYSDYERVSAATGLPTVLGWYAHEWLWRGNTDILNKRAADIEDIYTTTDIYLMKYLLEKYNIEYIYVGKLERDKYFKLNDDLIKSMGEVVYSSPETEEKPYETYIVRIKP